MTPIRDYVPQGCGVFQIRQEIRLLAIGLVFFDVPHVQRPPENRRKNKT
jgi:hypothetical protein